MIKPSLSSVLLLAACLTLAVHTLQVGRQLDDQYDRIQASASHSQPLISYRYPDGQTLYIVDYRQLQPGQPLGLVSTVRPLDDDYRPADLISTELAHGDAGQAMMISQRIAPALERLMLAAEADGRPLMISSAYRSIADQRQLYQDYIDRYGQAAADRYVAPVGTSEHHTGLSIDLSDASPACALDSDDCDLSGSTAAWLAERAPDYGFILRYPDGKSDITSVGYEPWHFRYVGRPTAAALTANRLTLDELSYRLLPHLEP